MDISRCNTDSRWLYWTLRWISLYLSLGLTGRVYFNWSEECSGSVGIVLDLGSKDRQFETQLSHCVVSLSKTLYPVLFTGLTQEDR